jgi:PAS domain S-box-containing protein
MKLTLNITVKLIGYLVVVSVLPLLLFGLSSYDLVRETIIKLASEYSEQLVGNQRDYLQLQMGSVEDLASRIASIEEISAVAAKTDAADESQQNDYDKLATQAQIRQSLNVYSDLKGVASIDLFTAKGHRFYVGDTLTVPPVDEQTRLRIYHAGLRSTDSIQWLGVTDNLNSASTNRKVLTALKIIRRYSSEKKTSEPVGMLLINYSTDYLAEHFRHVDLGTGSYLTVADTNGLIIFAPDKDMVGNPMPVEFQGLFRARKGSVALHLNERDALVTVTCMPSPAWCVFGVIPHATLLAPMQRLTQIAAVLMLLCFAVIAFASRHFRRNFVAPIKSISDGFRQIQSQQFEAVPPLPVPDQRDEISELVVWFNEFLEALSIRQRYEKELSESEYKFSSIFQLSPMPLALVRFTTSEFVDVNDFWLNQNGFSREEVIGHTALELNLWENPSDRAKMVEQLEQTQQVHRLEGRFRTKDGRILICLLFGRPFTFRDERLFIFSQVDVTHQRDIEKQIREINLQLESRVRSRTLKLESANAELAEAMESLKRTKGELIRSEKMAALGSLVAGVAHELNTPIGNSVTVASTLQDETMVMKAAFLAGGIRRTAVEAYFDTMVTGSELLMRNLGNARELITSFKQVAADQASNQRRRFELKETLEGIVLTILPMYSKSGYRMTCDLQEGISMDSYPGPLGQIVTNLVANALAHAFDGRSTGTMTLRSRRRDADHVEVTFSDDGVGIPQENQAKVFDPFFTTKLGQGGSGLGLSIIYNIVTGVLGGRIELESSDHGTVFTMTLPLSVNGQEGVKSV